MKCTSAQAAKLLRSLNDDYEAQLAAEEQSRSFLASVGEDVESVRPEYNYSETSGTLTELEAKIRVIKHALNVFNSTHTVPGFDMTVDQLLIYIPQLTRKKNRLLAMKSVLPKVREAAYGRGGNIIDYRYANYDIALAARDYAAVADTLSRAQTALDVLNNTEIMEIEL